MTSENPSFTDQQKEVIVQNFRKIEANGQLPLVYITLFKLAREFGHLEFAEVEKILDAENIELHLLAVPKDKFFPDQGWELEDPSDSSKNCKYAVFPVTDEDDALKLSYHFQFAYDKMTNLANLTNAGIPYAPENTALARSLKAYSRDN